MLWMNGRLIWFNLLSLLYLLCIISMRLIWRWLVLAEQRLSMGIGGMLIAGNILNRPSSIGLKVSIRGIDWGFQCHAKSGRKAWWL